jgi:hypothetical protein
MARQSLLAQSRERSQAAPAGSPAEGLPVALGTPAASARCTGFDAARCGGAALRASPVLETDADAAEASWVGTATATTRVAGVGGSTGLVVTTLAEGVTAAADARRAPGDAARESQSAATATRASTPSPTARSRRGAVAGT